MIDYQCTWWPDQWLGISITDCCIVHDLGGSDAQLWACVAEKGGIEFIILALVMLVGLTIGRPIYKVYIRFKNDIKFKVW
jgi:hypothetical protein